MTDAVKRTARSAEQAGPIRAMARAGFAAAGLVHLILGAILLVIAAGGRAEGDQAGAFKTIAAAPFGFAVLWILTAGLVALGLWHALEGVLAGNRSRARVWATRVSEFSQAIVYLALGALAAAVALGARPDGERTAQEVSRGILSLPGGPFLLGAGGLAIGAVGIGFVVMGVRRSWRERMSLPPGRLGRGIVVFGAVGFVAKGVALVIVGALVVIAAVRLDPETAGGLDGAIDALLQVPLGPWLVAAVGLGLIAYGVFCFFRSRLDRL